MSLRKVKLIEGEFYHIYNRGVDKRFVFLDKEDLDRFEQGIFRAFFTTGLNPPLHLDYGTLSWKYEVAP